MICGKMSNFDGLSDYNGQDIISIGLKMILQRYHGQMRLAFNRITTVIEREFFDKNLRLKSMHKRMFREKRKVESCRKWYGDVLWAISLASCHDREYC